MLEHWLHFKPGSVLPTFGQEPRAYTTPPPCFRTAPNVIHCSFGDQSNRSLARWRRAGSRRAAVARQYGSHCISPQIPSLPSCTFLSSHRSNASPWLSKAAVRGGERGTVFLAPTRTVWGTFSTNSTFACDKARLCFARGLQLLYLSSFSNMFQIFPP